MIRVTFTLSDETVAEIRRTAARLRKPQSQVVREAVAEYAARSDRLTDAHNRLVAVAACLRLNDRLCAHSLIFSAESPGFNLPQILR